MNFDSYITSGTKTAFTVAVNQKLIKYNKFSLKKAAFTLAETLITLTIIGVIAALTIPSLISEYQKHTYVVGLKKAYSQLQNAMKMIPITQGCPSGDFDCAGWYYERYYDSDGHWVSDVTNIEGQEFNGTIGNKRTYLLSKQFKINKLCYTGSTDEICKKIKNNLSTAKGNYYYGGSSFITNDGMIISSVGNATYTYNIDVNGFKGPNKLGRDQFLFKITDHEDESSRGLPQGLVVPAGSKLNINVSYGGGESSYWKNNQKCTTENVNKGEYGGKYCAGRVLEEDAMNY